MAPTPCASLDIRKRPKRGSDEWNSLCQKVREAVETQGFMLLESDEPSETMCDEMFAAMRRLFSLPVETKRRNLKPSPYHTYAEPNDLFPCYEGFSIMSSNAPGEVAAFTQLMWPQGDPGFLEILETMNSKFEQLIELVMSMIWDSYGLGKCFDDHAGKMDALFRMIKYGVSMTDEPAEGVCSHTDATFMSILCQNEVDGLMFQSRDGEWIPVYPTKGSFVVIVGDALRAWTNGRLFAPEHKVMLSGDKKRLSFLMFLSPMAEEVVEPAAELVDDEHPKVFKPFGFLDFVLFSKENRDSSANKLDAYARV